MNYDNLDDTIKKIARDVLKIETLETRNTDELDFYNLSVWSIREALEKARMYGYINGLNFKNNNSKNK